MLSPAIIGKNIRKCREKLNITQQELATTLYVSFQAVSAWERGLAMPDLENAAKLAEIFNVKLDVLLHDNSTNLYIAIDGGGTKTELVLFDPDGHIKKRLFLSGSNPNDIGIDSCIAVLTQGIDELLNGVSAKGLFAGIAGITTGNHIPTLQKALSERYGIYATVDTDAVNVLCMGKDIKNTAAVICGTGSCVFIRNNYKLTRLGGWGYLFDREGSAYDIGNDAIRHTLAVFDGLEQPTLLSDLVEKELGGNIWAKLSSVYEKGRPYIASFAPLVVSCAEKEDRVSRVIIENNARRLAVLLKLAVEKHGAPKEFICSGGFFQNKLFKDTVEKMSDISLYMPDTRPIYGGCIECMRLNNITPSPDFKNNFLESYR